MIRRISIIVAVTLFGLVFASLAANHVGQQSLPPLAKRMWSLSHRISARPTSSPAFF